MAPKKSTCKRCGKLTPELYPTFADGLCHACWTKEDTTDPGTCPLSLATTDALIHELFDRGLPVALVTQTPEQTRGNTFTFAWRRGPWSSRRLRSAVEVLWHAIDDSYQEELDGGD